MLLNVLVFYYVLSVALIVAFLRFQVSITDDFSLLTSAIFAVPVYNLQRSLRSTRPNLGVGGCQRPLQCLYDVVPSVALGDNTREKLGYRASWNLREGVFWLWYSLFDLSCESWSCKIWEFLHKLQWSFTIWHTIQTILLAFEDASYATTGTYYLTLATKTNKEFMSVSDYFRLALDLSTTAVDVVLAVVNRRQLKRY